MGGRYMAVGTKVIPLIPTPPLIEIQELGQENLRKGQLLMETSRGRDRDRDRVPGHISRSEKVTKRSALSKRTRTLGHYHTEPY